MLTKRSCSWVTLELYPRRKALRERLFRAPNRSLAAFWDGRSESALWNQAVVIAKKTP